MNPTENNIYKDKDDKILHELLMEHLKDE